MIPTLHRPEFLALCLENLANTSEPDLDVRICLDFSTAERLDEVDYVRDTYYPSAWLYHAAPHIDAPSGCWNILNSLKHGYDSGAEYVFLVEEDVLVYPNFFEKHSEMQNSGDYFATCGRLRQEHSGPYYTNPGACFKREKLAELVEYINDDFFRDRRGYMDRRFGVFDEASDLDDGLIRRVIRYTGSEVKYPDNAIVAHQGFHFYNKIDQYKNEGTIEQRIKNLRKMISNIDPSDRYAKDFEFEAPWTKLLRNG